MKELIYDYLQKNFRLSLDTYANHQLFDRNAKINKSVSKIVKEIKTVFYIDTDIFVEVFDEWVTIKYQELISGIVEVQERLEELTGREVSITSNDIYDLTVTNEKFIDYVKHHATYCVNEVGTDEVAVVREEDALAIRDEEGIPDLGEENECEVDGECECNVDDDFDFPNHAIRRMQVNADGSYWDSNGNLINVMSRIV